MGGLSPAITEPASRSRHTAPTIRAAVDMTQRRGRGAAGTATVPDRSALVRAGGAVVNGRASVAPGPAAAQLGVDLLQDLGGDLPDMHRAERGLDVQPDVALSADEPSVYRLWVRRYRV